MLVNLFVNPQNYRLMRAVCGLDVHKDTVYLCILCSDGEIIERVFGVLTFQLRDSNYSVMRHCFLGENQRSHLRSNCFDKVPVRIVLNHQLVESSELGLPVSLCGFSNRMKTCILVSPGLCPESS